MATAPTSTPRDDLALLFRRAGFGARPADLDAALTVGFEGMVNRFVAGLTTTDAAAEAVALPALDGPEALLAYRKTKAAQQATGGATAQQHKDFDVVRRRLNQQGHQAVLWWLDRMIVADQPLAEKLAWFWHGHFATSVQKIKVPKLMVEQLSVFREKGAGQWEALVQAASQDPAMLIWLDARQNVAAHPNENFARELFELFTLGIGHYTEADVKESARAFTGWSLDAELHPSFRPQVHDGGMKTVLGTTGPLKGEDVIRLATNHPDGDRFIASRMFSRFVRPITSDDPIAAELAGSFVSADRSVAALLKAVLLHPELRTEAGRTGLVKQPVEWLAGSMRALGLRPHPEDGGIVSALHAEGQVPFAPPSVGGWPANGAWLTSSAALARMQTAASLVAQPAAAPALDAVSGASAGDRVDAAAHLLSVSWSSATAAALAGQAGNPKTLVAAALSAPEYVLA